MTKDNNQDMSQQLKDVGIMGSDDTLANEKEVEESLSSE
jgi:hypothetical protein